MIEVARLTAQIQPSNTLLLFGAGSSIPSHAPSVLDLQIHFEKIFGEPFAGYSLAEQTAIIEHKTHDRRRLISELRYCFNNVMPTGAILNLPLYDWKSLFTTNYDKIIEDSYARKGRPYRAYSSNFDFGIGPNTNAVPLFKLHGTIDKDPSFGDQSRIILTENDYDLTAIYRDQLWDRFRADLAGSHLVIIGHSLADRDIKDLVDRAVTINTQSGGGGRITLLSYSRDEGRAALFESRGIEVCFGGLDDFFGGLASRVAPLKTNTLSPNDILQNSASLTVWTIDVGHSKAQAKANVSKLFNGGAATYADITAGFTFPRQLADRVEGQLVNGESPYAIILGPSGVGKTTAARQVMLKLLDQSFFCWEHKPERPIDVAEWRTLSKKLAAEDKKGCLFIDDAHFELTELNELVEGLVSDKNKSLRIVACSSPGHWRHRVKSPGLYKWGMEHESNRIQNAEIDGLIRLVDGKQEIRSLVGSTFSGYSPNEKRRRLIVRCSADMFVCLKNIFSNENLDEIILREYADLDGESQDIYKLVAAMEAAGVRVHRQLVIRQLGLDANSISGIVDRLSDVITESSEDEKEGIYTWRGRHEVIMRIIAQHKFHDVDKKYNLFDNIISSIQPTYVIEIKTLRGLCDSDMGISSIPDKEQQNELLKKMISQVPLERMPRHRLLRNLIDMGDYSAADTELRIFESDFKLDGPAARYKIDLAKYRALKAKGILDEDRIVLLDKACALASNLTRRFDDNKFVITSYCEAALELARFSNNFGPFDEAMKALKSAEVKTSDSDITRRISRFDARRADLTRGTLPSEVEVQLEEDAN